MNPVEWLIGAIRALTVPLTTDAAASHVRNMLLELGQVPFLPPDVSGWPSGQAWLSSAAADIRVREAWNLVVAGDISAVTDAPPTSRLDATAHLLGIDSWSARSAAVLRAAPSDPRQLVAVALNTPEYLTN